MGNAVKNNLNGVGGSFEALGPSDSDSDVLASRIDVSGGYARVGAKGPGSLGAKFQSLLGGVLKDALVAAGNGDLTALNLLNALGALSVGAVPAAAGAVRIPNNTQIQARNAGNTADIPMMYASSTVNIDSGGAGTTMGGLLNLLAGQLQFPASQNPSANANTLDDYEEGTWTPSVKFGGAAVGVTYSTQVGTYVKVGKKVTVTGAFFLTNKGSSVGTLSIEGLPFSSNTYFTLDAGYYQGVSGAAQIFGYGISGTLVQMQYGVATNSADLLNTNCTNTLGMYFKATFFI